MGCSSLLLVGFLLIGSVLATPPCFGTVGQVKMGYDLSWSASSGPLSGTHFNRWNYSVPALRYDVFLHRLDSSTFLESNNLFDFKGKMLYSWDGNQNCKRCPQPNITYACVPSGWIVQDVIFIAGAKCQKYVDKPLPQTKNAFVVTADWVGPTPWPVSYLSYDDRGNVMEAMQIQDFLQGSIEDPSSFIVPSFCQNAPVCKSIEHHLETSVASHLPEFMKRRFGWSH